MPVKPTEVNSSNKSRASKPSLRRDNPRSPRQNRTSAQPKEIAVDLSTDNPESNLQDGVEVKGVLDLMSDGYGFLRQSGLTANAGDVYVSSSQIRRFDLRVGDEIVGMARRPK